MLQLVENYSGSIQAFSTLVLVGVTICYAKYVKDSVEQEKDRIKKIFRPRIIIYLRKEKEGNNINLIISNFGKTTARNIKFSINTDCEFRNGDKLSEINVIKNGINILPSKMEKCKELGRKPKKEVQGKIKISYFDEQGEKFEEEYVLNSGDIIEEKEPFIGIV